MNKEQAKEKSETICKTYIPRKINDYRIEWQITSEDKNEGHCIDTTIFHLRMCAYGKYGKKDDRTLDYRIYTDSDFSNQVDVVLRNDLRSDLFNYLEVMNRI
jgi:hypothetical protein